MTRFSPSTRRALRFGAVVLGLLFLSACAGDAELDTRSNLQGPEAQDIESFLRWVLWIAYAVFFAVLGVTLYAWKNFRVKGEYEEGDWPEQIWVHAKISRSGDPMKRSDDDVQSLVVGPLSPGAEGISISLGGASAP